LWEIENENPAARPPKRFWGEAQAIHFAQGI